MSACALDSFCFVIGVDDDNSAKIVHVLGTFRFEESLKTPYGTDRHLPRHAQYSFKKLQDVARIVLHDIDDGVTFSMHTNRGDRVDFNVSDEASFSAFLCQVDCLTSLGQLNIASPLFEARLVPTGEKNSQPSKTADSDAGMSDRLSIGEGSDVSIRMAAVVAKEVTIENHNQSHDNNDNDDVVYVSTRFKHPSSDTGGDQGNHKSCQEIEIQQKDGIIGQLRETNLIPEDKMSALAWTFNLDVSKLNMETECSIAGMTERATIAQCAFIYELARRLHQDEDMQGIYNASDMGMGKTFTTLMLFVLRRLAKLTNDDLIARPDCHLSKDQAELGQRCNLTASLGIQCVCEKNSVLKTLHDRIPDSYGMVIAPLPCASVWLTEYTKFVKDTFEDPSLPFSNEPVLHAYAWDYKRRFIPLGNSPVVAYDSFLVQQPFTTNKKKDAIKIKARSGHVSDIWTTDELLSRLDEPFYEPFIHDENFTDVHRMSIMVMGQQRFSLQVSKKNKDTRRHVDVWVRGGAGKIVRKTIVNAFPFNPAMVVCDEAHLYKAVTNNVNTSLQGYVDRHNQRQRGQPFIALLSGTPVTSQPTDLISSSRLINKNEDRRHQVEQAIHELQRWTSSPDTSEFRTALREAYNVINPWMISQAQGSPMLVGECIPKAYAPPKEIVRKFDTPVRQRQSTERIIDQVRQAIIDNKMRIEPGSMGLNIAKISQSDLLWKVGPVPGLHACLEVDSGFPYRDGGVESDMEKYDDEETRASSSYMTYLNQLTGGDDMFTAMAHIVRMAARGVVAYKEDEKAEDEPNNEPLHAVLFTQYPCNAAAAYVYLKEKCSDVAEVVCLLSNTNAEARATTVRHLRESARNRKVEEKCKSIVIVTTFKLGGFGLNDFVFCSLLLQLGEPKTEADLRQAIGRIARHGQTKKTFRFHLQREGSETEELLRIRNERRVAFCGERLREMRLFRDVELIISEVS